MEGWPETHADCLFWTSETQGRHREVASEGSVEQNRVLTNRKG
jgi:hypothetical protein